MTIDGKYDVSVTGKALALISISTSNLTIHQIVQVCDSRQVGR